MKVADFFCGAGGFSEGFRMAGFHVVFGVDKWGPAIKTHEKNHPEGKTIPYDVEALSKLPVDEFESIIPDTEVIIGSPPCVAFSNSNKSGKGDKSLGNILVESYLRIVARKKFRKENPVLKYWILENVPNLKHHIKPFYTATDLGLEGDFELQDGFKLYVLNETSGEYNAKYFGVAQNRKRFFCGDFPAPIKTIKDSDIISLQNILNHLGEPNSEVSHKAITDPNYSNIRITSQDLTDHFYVKEIAKFEWEKAKRAKLDKGYMGQMSFPENKGNPSRTIMATMSSSSRESIIYDLEGEVGRYRTPTIREISSIMSFPLDYQFYGDSILTKYRLVGNAVAPKLAFAFAKAIAEKEGEFNNKICVVSERLIPSEDFTNLNNSKIPLNVEKKKDINKARYKYHIPYLIIKAFRVELTNHQSDFDNLEFIWSTEIHKGQGKNKKLIDASSVSTCSFNENIKRDLEKFIEEVYDDIPSSNKLQENYCMTSNQRETNNIMGPDEMLYQIKTFLEALEAKYQINNDYIYINNNLLPLIPMPIAIGCYLLNRIVTITNSKCKNS